MADFVAAIDGPAGSGKSSVSKEVARQLGWGYLDTGAAYRALTWATQNIKGLELDQLPEVDLASEFDYAISIDPDRYWVRVSGIDVTLVIRSTKIAEAVSEVARVPAVRTYMKQLTRALVAECPKQGIVVEGRDITSVVLPDANIRLLLTASEEVRLKRRSAEVGASHTDQVAKQVTHRDNADSQVVDFMTPAEGVQLLDSTNLSFDQTVSAVVKAIEHADFED